MAPPNITTTLALESDAAALASILTAGFSASDVAYPLIWGSAAPGTHDTVSVKGLFTPVQKVGRETYKAVDSVSGRIVGFATWNLPKEKAQGGAVGGGLPEIPGVNMELWTLKAEAMKGSYSRDVQVDKDMRTSPIFHKYYEKIRRTLEIC
jgi:hypothetical protein